MRMVWVSDCNLFPIPLFTHVQVYVMIEAQRRFRYVSKRQIVLLLLLLLASPFLTAASTASGLSDQSIGAGSPSATSLALGVDSLTTGLLEGMATSDGYFSLSLTPDFAFNKLAFQLDLKLKGRFYTDPVGLDLDFTDWLAPQRTDGQTNQDYFTNVLYHYSTFVRYAQWGQRYEPMYIRFGKLTGITLGDGALLNGYFDRSVPSRQARPGLDMMLDGLLIGIPNAGFEFLMDDLFNPTLTAWRIFARPLYGYDEFPTLSKLETGLSFAKSKHQDPDADTGPLGRTLLGLDFSLPMIDKDLFNLQFFFDSLVQTPDHTDAQPGFAYRTGFWGRTKSFFVFNTSVTIPMFGHYYADYFEPGFESRTSEELAQSLLNLGTMRLDSLASLNFDSMGLYVKARLRSDYSDSVYSNYKFQVNTRIDKRLFNIVSLDLSYEKLYPTSTGEGFFEGLGTLRNVVLTASTIVKMKPYSFDIGLSLVFDEQAQSSLQIDTTVRIAIL